ncbi:MAG: thiamine-phosphate kinase [Syntrophobacteraceae bacterium]
MLVRDIGEFGLIERIARMLPVSSHNVVTGIGDDVAVLRTSGPEYLLATCDIQVEGVHFIREAITAYQLGRKVVAINVSDIASMGGIPRWALISLAIPDDTQVEFIEELYRGMREQASLADALIVGGNVSRMESRIAVDLTLLGEIPPEHLLLRSTARTGDAVLVTGSPGESRAGLELIRREKLEVGGETRRMLIAKHLMPQPRLREGQLLGRSGLVHAMIDISDGLLADLGHICRASAKGAELQAALLPVSDSLTEAAGSAGSDALEWLLSGGEDYELLFTALPDAVPLLQKMLLDETGIRCTWIGNITDEAGHISLRLPEGNRVVIPSGKGWDHFAGYEQKEENR